MAGAPDNKYTYDIAAADGGPHKPDLAELGGEDFRDRAGSAPQKGIDPYAGFYSEHARNVAGLNRLTATALLWLEWDSGNSRWNIFAVDAMGTKVVPENFQLTPGSPGELQVAWTAGTLPTMERKPVVHVTDSFGDAYGQITGANTIVLAMRDDANVAANINVCVEIR